MITLEKGSIEVIIQEGAKLLQDHYDELTLHKEIVKLNPNWGDYRKLEAASKLVVVLCKDDGRLIGYSIFFISNHMHYKDLCIAVNDVLFLLDEYRSASTAGLRLIKESEAVLKDRGVGKIMWHIKYSHDWSLILERLGYGYEEFIMGKVI